MGIFNFFKKNRNNDEALDSESQMPTEEQFIEKNEPNVKTESDERRGDGGYSIIRKTSLLLKQIYDFAEGDFDTRGYNDAIYSEGEFSYREDNLKTLKIELENEITKAKGHCEDLLSRYEADKERAETHGLVDALIKFEKSIVIIQRKLEEIEKIEKDAKGGTGLYEQIKTNYISGFKRGVNSLLLSGLIPTRSKQE